MTPARKIKTLFFRLHQQSHRCFYCGCDLTAPENEVSLDHVAPQCLGWIKKSSFDEPRNTVASCFVCNQKKGDRLPYPEEDARLEELNKTYSDEQADLHYVQMLKLSVHLLKVIGFAGVKN